MTSENFSYDEFISYKSVSRETFTRLHDFVDLLLKWQKKINLISSASVTELWRRHIIDSAQLTDHINPAESLVDIGSGAGFPGLILAILGINNMTLVESDGRKVAFLKEAARITKTDVVIIHNRIEAIDIDGFSMILARGFAALKNLLDILTDTLKTRHKLLLLKGKQYVSEIRQAQETWAFDYKVFPSLTDKEGAILLIQNPQRLEGL